MDSSVSYSFENLGIRSVTWEEEEDHDGYDGVQPHIEFKGSAYPINESKQEKRMYPTRTAGKPNTSPNPQLAKRTSDAGGGEALGKLEDVGGYGEDFKLGLDQCRGNDDQSRILSDIHDLVYK